MPHDVSGKVIYSNTPRWGADYRAKGAETVVSREDVYGFSPFKAFSLTILVLLMIVGSYFLGTHFPMSFPIYIN